MSEYRFLFKKTSVFPRSATSWKTTKALEKYINNYQDEVGKETFNLKRGRPGAFEGKQEAPTGKKPPQWRNPKTHGTGVLLAGGFLRNRRSPGKTEPRKQKAWVHEIVKEWGLLLRTMTRRKNDGSRMALTISKKTIEDLTRCGISPDIAAQEILQDGLELYARRHGWKKESLGWISGFHHDRDHFHLHVLLFPTTKEGHPLRLSNGNEKDGEVRDDLTDLTGAVNVAAEMFYQRYLPYEVQDPEVQLAWWKNTEAPMPRIEDYRIENPLPQKYMVEDEKAEIRKKKQEAISRKKRAEESLQIERSKNPEREKELLHGVSPIPPEKEGILSRLLRHHLWTETLGKQKEALKGEEKDIYPESKDPAKAQRAVNALGVDLPAASSHLQVIEKNIQESLKKIEARMEANRNKERILDRILSTWSQARLGLAKWRLEKLAAALQEPALRARTLATLTLAHSFSVEGPSLLNTESGLEDLRSFAKKEAVNYQKRAEKILEGTSSEEEAGQKLTQARAGVDDAISRAKKELARFLSLKTLLQKTQDSKKTTKETDLLLLGAKLRLKIISDQKEMARAMIRIRRKDKTPLPARDQVIPKTLQKEEGPRSQEKAFALLKLPRFLDPSRLNPLIEERISDINSKKEQKTGEPILSTEPQEKSPDPMEKWKSLGEKSSIEAILLEIKRRKGKTKETPPN